MYCDECGHEEGHANFCSKRICPAANMKHDFVLASVYPVRTSIKANIKDRYLHFRWRGAFPKVTVSSRPHQTFGDCEACYEENLAEDLFQIMAEALFGWLK